MPEHFLVADRVMMSRINASAITVTEIIPHGVTSYGCCACCYAPDSCPGCAVCPCIKDPKYIVKEMEASKYIYVRENSIEWNQPVKISKEGDCCGVSCCLFRAQDQISVLYFDDPLFDNITDKSRCCNDCITFCCGGEGELVQIDAKFCCGCCYRAIPPFFFGVPVCCGSCCPIIKHKIWVAKASDAIRSIKGARDNAKERMKIGS
ncbi:hypothetical protein TrRE_jg3980 [Triparma retinervis]|uniref:Uncharacterized protein n=1 Tax=Triparma retinervis TaxID=2557542 RepID=A0A9W7L6Q1_9STRA|nr:hypothetical protein TrRE_jg3980 [Triparma retinervis]